MNLLRSAMWPCLLVCALFSAPSFSGPLIPIPTERVTWGIDGILNATFPLGGSSLSANAGDPFSIDLEFELDTVWTQCSPCISVGDREWRGKITEFNLNIAGAELEAVFDGIFPNFVIVRPGDDASEADQTSLRLGTNSPSSVQSPFQVRYQEELFDAAFSLYISDYSSALFGSGPQSWLHPSVPTGRINSFYLTLAPVSSPFLWTDSPTLTAFRTVPEPSVPALLGLAILGLLFSRRRR